VNEAVHVSGFFFGNVIRDIETLDLSGKFAGKVACIKLRDQVNARCSGKQVGPGVGHGIAYRANTTKTCHNDTTTAHSVILKKKPEKTVSGFSGLMTAKAKAGSLGPQAF
jgi:hypothetical protein